MRTLRFYVDRQSIWRDRNCDFSHIKPGTKEEIRLEFIFSQEWDLFTKVVGFWNRNREECKPQILQDNNTCTVPKEALKDFIFYIEVLGKYGNLNLNTERIAVVLDGR